MPNRVQDSLGSSRSGSSKQHWGTDQRKLWPRRDQFVVERRDEYRSVAGRFIGIREIENDAVWSLVGFAP